jgi:hypothetical protein
MVKVDAVAPTARFLRKEKSTQTDLSIGDLRFVDAEHHNADAHLPTRDVGDGHLGNGSWLGFTDRSVG